MFRVRSIPIRTAPPLKPGGQASRPGTPWTALGTAMANLTAPRLRRDRAPAVFWAAACLIAFTLSFAMGSVWAERRLVQDGWTTAAATFNR